MTRPAVFIDLDGTIIVEKVYLSDPDGVEVIPGAVDAMKELRDAGFAIVVVTNQAGIGRGLYSVDDYHAVAARVRDELVAQGLDVTGTYFCPHHPDTTGPCDCRKPGTGMYRRAAADHDLVLADSFYVGDKVSDVLGAQTLGGQGVLVRTGYGKEHEFDAPDDIWVVDDLAAAAKRILTAAERR